MKKIFKKIILEMLNTYEEIEFVCYNSDSPTSTNRDNQLLFYNNLKILEKQTNYSILPYMQDFSEGDHQEISLAVIIFKKDNEDQLKKIIFQLAKEHNVEFDLYNEITEKQVNSIIRGEYDNLII